MDVIDQKLSYVSTQRKLHDKEGGWRKEKKGWEKDGREELGRGKGG